MKNKTDSCLWVNAKIWTPTGLLHNQSLTLKKGKIQQIQKQAATKNVGVMDVEGQFVLPGLVDLHVNGIDSCDLSQNPKESLAFFAAQMAKRGVTSFLPTLISNSIPQLIKSIKGITPWIDQTQNGARPLGIHLEGPFIHPKRRGAHSLTSLHTLSLKQLKGLVQAAHGKCRKVTLAPELDKKAQALKYLKRHQIVASMGHSNASYDEAKGAIRAGYSHATHLFNAMPPWHHRQPGLAGAILESSSVTAEIIADGTHVSPSVFEMALKLKGFEKMILVSDEWVGLNQKRRNKWKHRGNAYWVSKTLVGSACSILEGMASSATKRNWTELLPLATINPSKALGLSKKCGSIEVGKWADLVVVTKDLKVLMTVVGGKCVYRHPSWKKKERE